MSWSYLPEPAEESTEACCSDTLPYALWKSLTTTGACCCSASATESFPGFPCGTTCARSTAGHGEDLSTSCQADFHVKTSAPPEKAPESTARSPASGERWRASFARFDRDTCSWRTAQCSLLGDSGESSVIWPRSGMTVGGLAYPLPTVARRTSGTGYGFLAPDGISSFHTPNTSGLDGGSNSRKALKKRLAITTPRANDAEKRGNIDAMNKRNGLAGFVRQIPTPSATDWKGSSKPGQRRGQLTDPAIGVIQAGGLLNPEWVEWLQGWPIGSTAFSPLAMDRFREFMRQHGGCCHAIHDVCGDFVQKTVDS